MKWSVIVKVLLTDFAIAVFIKYGGFTDIDMMELYVCLVIVTVLFISAFMLLFAANKTELMRKLDRESAANYVEMMDAGKAKKGGLYYAEYNKILKYMKDNGIKEMEIAGKTIRLKEAEVIEKPARERVLTILREMDYTPECAERIVHKGIVQLGERVRFDELLKFCLEE